MKYFLPFLVLVFTSCANWLPIGEKIGEDVVADVVEGETGFKLNLPDPLKK